MVARATARTREVPLSVSTEPEVISIRDELEQAEQLRRQARSIEHTVKERLEQLRLRSVLMQPIDTYEVRQEVERFGGHAGSVQMRQFGETGWRMAHSQLRPVPATGQVVAIEIECGEAYIVIAETHFRCEWRFNLKHFTVQVREES